jgi:hypothetical protein
VDLTAPQEDIGYHFWIKTRELHVTSEWTTLRPLGPEYPGTTYASEITFGRDVADRLPDEQIAIVKVTHNGTDLKRDWHPSGEEGTLYQTLLDRVDLAVGQLEQNGFEPQMGGFIWVQGSGDANSEEKGTEYETHLNTLIASVRRDWGESDLPVLFNQYHIDTNKPADGVAAIRQSQANVAAADPRALMINIDDLSLKSDLVHFTGHTQQELGYRFADAILPWIPALRLLGDMDGDHNVDVDDIDDFVLGLSEPAEYEQHFGVPPWLRGDTEEDGDFDFDDIVYFIEILNAPLRADSRTIPEPSSLALTAFSVLAWLGYWWRRHRAG